MSSKDDRDNRSNQLNPNNSAYESSRGTQSSSYGDDDDSCTPPHAPDYRYITQRPITRKTGQYGVGVVNQQGQARFFTFTLEASREHLFHGTEQTVVTDLEIYFESFTDHLRRMFSQHFKGYPALFCLFDGTTSCLPWHVPLDLQNPGQMCGFLATCSKDVRKDAAPEKIIESLRTVLRPPFEDWGSFRVEARNVSTLKFTYEERCKTAIMSKP
ncbi:hypothetical protein [Pseudomonas fluorescens]|uniref:Uncharacterized protein n=1 Tax=Pseudomonas fluorescens TaxID=294 RepID=A0A5E7V3T4_PSEFL|nr:hypothetical protein [Pseudomonas fluorescens]VVQ18617.1 hypothetical protein PS928_04697 [Pseudomonas fluorescens]